MSAGRVRRPVLGLLPMTALAAAVLAGCTSVASVPVPAATTPAPSATVSGGTTTSAAQTCTDAEKQQDPTRSYPPATDIPALVQSDPVLQRIKKSNRLVVGVSADTRLLGARNPQTNRFEGFDIDIAEAVATAIFGTPKVEFRAITTAQRIPLLQSDSVDIVARAMTITCDRWKQIAFSTVYFRATQKLLVSTESKVNSISQLPSGSKICASRGSTSVDLIKQKYTQFTPVEVAANSECLVLFQEGKVDAITGDDAILAGFAAQDPYAKVVADLQSPQPYGIGVKLENKALVQVVNKVLADIRADGRWQQFYDTSGLKAALKVEATPPAPVYGRE